MTPPFVHPSSPQTFEEALQQCRKPQSQSSKPSPTPDITALPPLRPLTPTPTTTPTPPATRKAPLLDRLGDRMLDMLDSVFSPKPPESIQLRRINRRKMKITPVHASPSPVVVVEEGRGCDSEPVSPRTVPVTPVTTAVEGAFPERVPERNPSRKLVKRGKRRTVA